MNHLITYEHRESINRYWVSRGENPTLAHFSHFSSLFTNPNRRNAPNSAATPNKPPILPRLSTNYNLIMQNKANFPDAQMNVTSIITKDYENVHLHRRGKNKANSKPIKANLLNAQMNVYKVITRDYENIANCKLGENKANTKPKQTQTNPISEAKKCCRV